MLLREQYFNIKWNARTRNWYENRGYIFTNTGDEFTVKAEDLSLGSKHVVKVECDYCHDIVNVVYKNYVKCKGEKYSCKHCRQTKTSQNNLLKRQEYLYNGAKSFCNKMGYILLTQKEDIINSETRVDYMCPKHGLHNTKIYSILLEYGCSGCQYENNSKNLKNTIEDVVKLGDKMGIIILNPNEYLDYYTVNLKCVCNKCGDVYTTSYQMLKQDKCLLCQVCSKSESHGETKIRLYLEKHRVQFEQQKRFDDCRTKVPLPFDFYIPSLNTIIEYDGEGHYYQVDFKGHNGEYTFKRTVENDKIKNKYCKDNNIRLIRIPYWDYNNIEIILDKNLFTQRYSLVS